MGNSRRGTSDTTFLTARLCFSDGGATRVQQSGARRRTTTGFSGGGMSAHARTTSARAARLSQASRSSARYTATTGFRTATNSGRSTLSYCTSRAAGSETNTTTKGRDRTNASYSGLPETRLHGLAFVLLVRLIIAWRGRRYRRIAVARRQRTALRPVGRLSAQTASELPADRRHRPKRKAGSSE